MQKNQELTGITILCTAISSPEPSSFDKFVCNLAGDSSSESESSNSLVRFLCK